MGYANPTLSKEVGWCSASCSEYIRSYNLNSLCQNIQICVTVRWYTHSKAIQRGFRLLMATARFHDHVRVLFKDHVVAVVEVKNRNGGEFGGRAAGLWHDWRIHEMYQRLHNSVVCSVHVRAEGKRAFAETKKRRVSLRCDDPILPSKPLEADVQHPTTTALGAGALERAAHVGKLWSQRTRCRARWTTRARLLRVKSCIRYILLAVSAVEGD